LATAAAFTWLNPHVYLDTLGLIGAISTQFLGSDKLAFSVGAVTASFVFFFGLAYGARRLAPVMQSARAWRILDVIIGAIMFALAFKLLFS
jgi:L-lysine exporter family protein LysE/ArgO